MGTYLGIDIGGTKCAVSLAKESASGLEMIAKQQFATPKHDAEGTITRLLTLAEELLTQHQQQAALQAIGISCGGPLNTKQGLILSPPNLPSWDEIQIVQPFADKFQVPVSLQNDANAGALAEWLWGAGKNCDNLIFLTFGTGMGAGLILQGKLYAGTNDMAGEIGHVRLASDGPIGYGKAGSFEGFCSGGGIAQLAQQRADDLWRTAGKRASFWSEDQKLEEISAKDLFAAVESGDPLALELVSEVAQRLGAGLAILIDLLNPQKIVIGSIYRRQQKVLATRMMEVLRQEALPLSLAVCEILPAELGEEIGDYAALAIARYAVDQERS